MANSGLPPSPAPRRTSPALRGFAVQLIALTILPLTALLVVIALGSITIHQREMRSLVVKQDERTVRAAAVALSERLTHHAALLRALADRGAEREGQPQGGQPQGLPLHDVLSESSYLIADFDGGVAFYSPQTQWLAASTPESAWATRPIARLLPQALSKAQPIFSEPFDDSTLGQTAIVVASPSADGSLLAVGVFSPATLGLPDLGPSLGAGPRAHTMLVSADGQPLFESGSANNPPDPLDHPGVQAALRGERGAIYAVDSQNDEEVVVAYSPVAPVGWALIVEEPWSDVVSPLLQTSQIGPLVLIPALVLAGLGLVLAVRRVIHPLQQLERESARLASGDFTAIEEPVGGIGEIESLQGTLVRMARQIHGYQESIRSYLGALTRGQEDERQRLARELHDDTVQSLIALDQRAQLAQLVAKNGSPQAAERLAEVRRMTASLIEDVRRVIRALR
ncbi:MAG: HAMP domain-containing protein, partial [Chloroflexi bacterium]|nr:HAMP domain-containing protein [Chloroflexota bacterium]